MKPTQEQITGVFEKTWSKLSDEYHERRDELNFYSEADLQVHLAKKLVERLPSGWVHVEMPLPLARIREFESDLHFFGRPMKRGRKGECYNADIAIVDTEEEKLCLIAELKYTRLYWSLDYFAYPLLSKQKERDDIQFRKKELKKLLQSQKESKIRRQDFNYFLFNVSRLSAVLRELRILRKQVQGSLCVIDELYPNAPLEKELRKAIRKYDPEIELLVFTYSSVEILEEILNSLETTAKS